MDPATDWQRDSEKGSSLLFDETINQAAVFPGSYVSQANTPVTLMCWAKRSGYETGDMYFLGFRETGVYYGMNAYLQWTSSNQWLAFYVKTSGTAVWGRSLNALKTAGGGSNIFVPGEWGHFAVTWTGIVAQNQITFYYNGDTTITGGLYNNTTPSGSPNTCSREITIGGAYPLMGTNVTFNGNIACVKKYDRMLSVEEIRQHVYDPNALYRQQQVVSVAVPSAPRWPFGMQGGTSVLTGGLT
jgi:hypothetical protein